MLSINTNLSSLIAQNSLNTSTNKLSLAVERMSTGYKINHAKDNAANYSISTNMTTKIGAYQVAEDNAAMGLDMITTASDTIGEMQCHAERLRALATQARNGTYGAQSLNAMQEEANAIYAEINRLYSTAKYNGISLFNQSEYDIPDDMPKADPVTGFIENPYDYSEEEIAEMTPISKVNSFESGKTYSISSAKDLKHFADIVNAGNTGQGSTFVLTADIDLSEYSSGEGWVPIGDYTTDSNNRFKGTFNGNGHVISNLKINRPTINCQGLFGYCDSGFKILNLGINETKVIGGNNVGSLIGMCNTGNTVINNCYSSGEIQGNIYVGGLVGRSDAPYTTSCYSYCNVIGDFYVGGLVGQNYYFMANCFSNSNVFGNRYVGGLAGSQAITYLQKNNYCYTKGNIQGDSNVGGLYGNLWACSTIYNDTLVISNCISFSKIKGNSNSGSFVGFLKTAYNGVVSLTSALKFENCYTANADIFKVGFVGVDANTLDADYDLSSLLAGIDEIQLRDITTNLQVGIKNGESSQLKMNTNFEYKLGEILRSGIGSDLSLKAIDEFTNLLSSKQTELGATQNRLESVLDEISTQYENLVSSRSTLRDADIAQVSSTYIQQQILQQASATLMATANQSPAIALQLI